MKKFTLLLAIIVVAAALYGCADMETTTPMQVLENPFGVGGVKKGMTKDEIRERFGDPTAKSEVVSDEWGGSREEWFYAEEDDIIPIKAGYINRDLYIYFDGDSVTNVSSEPIKAKKKILID